MKRFYILFLLAVVFAGASVGLAAAQATTQNFGSSNPLPAGSNVVGKFGIDQTTQGVTNGISLAVIGSILNSSTAQISSGATFTGTCESTLASNSIQVNVVSDQNITLEVDQSATANCSSIASTFTYTIPASSPSSPYSNYTTQATNSFYRIKATNAGASTTTTFRVDVALCPVCNYGFASGGTAVIGFSTENGNPATATSGNPVPALGDQNGAIFVRPEGGPNLFNCSVTLSTATTTQCQAAPAAGLRNYITGFIINTTSAGTGSTIQPIQGTGTNCGSSTANLSAIAFPNTTVGLTSVEYSRVGLVPVAGDAVCFKQAGTAGTSVVEAYGFVGP